jgi:hypothetical protein
MGANILAEAVKWIVTTFGKDILVVAKDALQGKYRKLFASRNVLVLGPKQSGKSSLIQLVTSGQPFELVNGEIRAPAPTALGAIVDKKFQVQQGNWLRLKKDLPGDLDLRDTWTQAIADICPAGIIYMLDGRRSDEKLRSDIGEFRDHILIPYPAASANLAAVHFIVSFSDQWATSPMEVRRRLRNVRSDVEELFESLPQWSTVRLGVSAAHLSPNKGAWDDAERAIQHFGADLKA